MLYENPQRLPNKTDLKRPLTDIIFTAIQNRLVTSTVLAYARERLDDPQPKFFALLRLVDGNIFDMANTTQPTDELALDKDRADGYDRVCILVDDDEGVVRAWEGSHGLELRCPCGLAWVRDGGEDFEHVEMTAAIIRRGEGAYLLEIVRLEYLKYPGGRTRRLEGSRLWTSAEMSSGEKSRSREESGVKVDVFMFTCCFPGIQNRRDSGF